MDIMTHDGQHTYRRISNLSFATETDLTLSTVPVCGFSADIHTTDDVDGRIDLYDDMDALWASYIVTSRKRKSADVLHVEAQSDIAVMENWTLGAEMFSNYSADTFVRRLYTDVPASGSLYPVSIAVHYSIRGASVTGFCPEQTARERLQWLCLAIGAMVKQWHDGTLMIVPVPKLNSTADATLIPLKDTYWRPDIEDQTEVADVAFTVYYGFHKVTDPDTDTSEETAEDSAGDTWGFNSQTVSYKNTGASAGSRGVSVDGVTLINRYNYGDISAALTYAYFAYRKMEVEVINNGQYWPGDKVRIYSDESTIYEGYIQSCNFTFGLQAKSRMTVLITEPVQTAKLTVKYNYRLPGGAAAVLLGSSYYYLPLGEVYSVTNPFLTIPNGGSVTTYTPEVETIIGPLTQATSRTVEYAPASLDVAYIAIDTPPTKLTYQNGERIDLTGIVVRAYDENGGVFDVWYDGGEKGVIPPSKLYHDATATGSGEQDLNIWWPYNGETYGTILTITVTT